MVRTPGDILGNDKMLQLIFEGYAVVPMKPTDAIIKWMEKTADGPGRGFAEFYSMLMNIATGETAETD
jgi:hypothetical protein